MALKMSFVNSMEIRSHSLFLQRLSPRKARLVTRATIWRATE